MKNQAQLCTPTAQPTFLRPKPNPLFHVKNDFAPRPLGGTSYYHLSEAEKIATKVILCSVVWRSNLVEEGSQLF